MEVIYWLWIQDALGIASNKLPSVLQVFGTPERFYNSSDKEKRATGLFSAGELSKIARTDLKPAINNLKVCGEKYIDIITPDDEAYPPLLKRIANPPAVLYVWGKLPFDEDDIAITMVGSRKYTAYGEAVSYRLASSLAAAGAIVVSGGAMGIDSACHRGAIDAGGQTVCVLGCGIDYDYLPGNRALRKSISQNGAVVSEFPPNFPSSKYTFPIRNRIMSGISHGTVVTEAPVKSGALITASRALEQNRDVFAVNGSALEPSFEGTRELIRDGAKPVASAMDVLSEYIGVYQNKLKLDGADVSIFENLGEIIKPEPPVRSVRKLFKNRTAAPRTGKAQRAREMPQMLEAEVPAPAPIIDIEGLSPMAREIYEIMLKVGTCSPDYLCDKLKKPCGSVLASLTELEIRGVINALPGNKFSIK